MRFHIALDSGAHSIYYKFLHVKTDGSVAGENINFRADRLAQSKLASYTHTKEFRGYLDNYAAFVVAQKGSFTFCVSLDVIYNPQRSYELWCELEALGVRTLPVVHYGEDVSWLKKYMDRTDYIGIGGMGQGISSKTAYWYWARDLFSVLTDKHGKPKWKTHGFAMTSVPLLRQFPWTSVDSSSAFFHSRTGSLVVPRLDSKGQRDYLRDLAPVAMTQRGRTSRSSYLNTAPTWRAHVDSYIKEFDTVEGVTVYKSVARDMLNAITYYRVAQAVSRERESIAPPLTLYLSGRLGGSPIASFLAASGRMEEAGVPDLYYMGSYMKPESTHFLLREGLRNGKAYETQPRPRLRKK